MSKFLCQLDMRLMWGPTGEPLKNRDGRQLFQLLADFSYQSDVAKCTFTVPAGFVTDLASIPRIPFLYDALAEVTIEPPVIHDYLYSKAIGTRAMADKVLLEAMEVTGVPWIKRKLIYAGVRVGGASHFGS